MTDIAETTDPKAPSASPESAQEGSNTSTAARALAAAGDAEQAQDVAALDDSALAAQKRLGASRRGLVERLVYGPRPKPAELGSGTAISKAGLSKDGKAIVDAAVRCMAKGEAFEADGKLSAALRSEVAAQKGYGFTVPGQFGGADAGYGDLALVEEELATNGLGALAVEVSGELTIGAGSLLGYGTDKQKSTFLPMLSEGRLMAFALTEVGVGVNAKKVQSYVELDEESGCWRLSGDGARSKMYITNASHGAIAGLVARIGKKGKKVGLFIVELPEHDVAVGDDVDGKPSDWGFTCASTEVSAFTANHNSRMEFTNFPIPRENQIEADGVEVLFYCLRMGRCMLAAMSAGYQRMLATDAAYFARLRPGVGGRVIKHELPRLNLGIVLGGALQARSLSHLSLQQDADGVDLAGLRDLTKSAASGTAMESQIATEHVLGGRTFHTGQRTSEARANIHVFGVVEGEDDLILMGMVKDVTGRFTERYMAGMLGVIQSINGDGQEPILRITPMTALRSPKRVVQATLRLLTTLSFYKLVGWIIASAVKDVLHLPMRLVPTRFHPRYKALPARLRGHARKAERKLSFVRWQNLGINLWFQLELTRAQIPLQRLGKTLEHLTSIVALCHHAAAQDITQQRIADLQSRRLFDKVRSIRLLSDLVGMGRFRDVVAEVGSDIEFGRSTLIHKVKPEMFAQPWE